MEDEVLKLGDMYGHSRYLASLPEVVAEQMGTLKTKLRKMKMGLLRKAAALRAKEREKKKKKTTASPDEKEGSTVDKKDEDQQNKNEKDKKAASGDAKPGDTAQDQVVQEEDAPPTPEQIAAMKREEERTANLVKEIGAQIERIDLLRKITGHVEKLAPHVKRFGSLFDEEQERELEQELEEERQVGNYSRWAGPHQGQWYNQIMDLFVCLWLLKCILCP